VPKSEDTSPAKNGKGTRGRTLAQYDEQARIACDGALIAVDRADQAVGELAHLEGSGRRVAHLAWWIARQAIDAMMLKDDDPRLDWIDEAWSAYAGHKNEQAMRYVLSHAALVQDDPGKALDHCKELLSEIGNLELEGIGQVASVPLSVVDWLGKVTDDRALPGTFTPQGALARIALSSRGERLTSKAIKTEADRFTRHQRK
jgi:hypothetical protein